MNDVFYGNLDVDEKRLYELFNRDMVPYLMALHEISTRLRRAIEIAVALRTTTDASFPVLLKDDTDDMLRSVVVFAHAYLEDFLRTLARQFLPAANKDALNDVPLVGMRDHKKFQLGDLSQHIGKSVEEVIEESVNSELERTTYNNTGAISSLLMNLKFTVPEEHLPALGEMMQRRHTIVHRADRVLKDKKYVRQTISKTDVENWLSATYKFMHAVLKEVAARQRVKWADEMAEEYKDDDEG